MQHIKFLINQKGYEKNPERNTEVGKNMMRMQLTECCGHG